MIYIAIECSIDWDDHHCYSWIKYEELTNEEPDMMGPELPL